jgi:hypothetical protein
MRVKSAVASWNDLASIAEVGLAALFSSQKFLRSSHELVTASALWAARWLGVDATQKLALRALFSSARQGLAGRLCRRPRSNPYLQVPLDHRLS